MKVALSFAIGKVHDFLDFSKPIDPNALPLVNIDDFRKAIAESKPLFGVDETFAVYKSNKLLNYGAAYTAIEDQVSRSIDYVKRSENS